MSAMTLEWARANAAWHFSQWQVRFLQAQDMRRLLHSLRQNASDTEPPGLLNLVTNIQRADAAEKDAYDHLRYLEAEAQLKKAPRHHVDIDDLPRQTLRKMLEDDQPSVHDQNQMQRMLFWHALILLMALHAVKRDHGLAAFALWF